MNLAENLIKQIRESPLRSVKEILKGKLKNKSSSRLPDALNKTSRTDIWCKARNDLTKHHQMEIESSKNETTEVEEEENPESEEEILIDEETFKIVSKQIKYQVNLMN